MEIRRAMFTETMQQDDAVVGLVCAGKLCREDLKRIHALLHERLAARPRPELVVDLRDFVGYESLPAVLEDVKMDMAHRNDFSRIAVTGNRAWMEWGSKLVKVLTSADMQWFDVGDADRAVEWARRGS